MKELSYCDLVADHVRHLAPYQPGKPMAELERELGLTSIIKLASNENPLGPSPHALEAIAALKGELALYPDGNGFELKNALSAHYALDLDHFVLGNGSNDILDLVARTFLGPGTSAVYAQYGFAVYPIATQTMGARGIEVPALQFGHDLPAMIRAIAPDTRVLFIANPNNPTGTFLPGDDLRAGLRQIPSEVVVVLDEAYTEYLSEDQCYDPVAWLDEFPNLLICRTFSKAYGLAGLRVGFGMGHPQLIALLNRIRQPFNVSVPGLRAASAALGDREFLERTRALNAQGRRFLETAFDSLGLSCLPSFGNFMTVAVGQGRKIYDQLLRQGVIVRPLDAYGLPHHLRVSIGTQSENRRFVEALTQSLAVRTPVSAVVV
ncbi:histidinol-phosphate transaminase [Ferrovum sp.]|uniref:histidinol-phosphate transaminase n=1 Tax=Ferrovum sp. TaxID=2609467 RepID=UPI0026120E75|nr:histidinol-phosphate transaminase [Ferrovum sp.]